MFSRCWMVMLVAAGLMFFAAHADAGATKPLTIKKKKVLREFQVKPGTLKGIVKDTRGRPMKNATIELRNAKGKTIAKTVTNSRGEYLFKNVPAGQYDALINGKATLKLTMTPAANVSRLLIIPPSAAAGGAKAAAGGGAGAGSAAAGVGTWTWVLIGAGTAVVVGGGAAVVANNRSSGSSNRPISP